MILYHKERQIPMFSEEEIKRRWQAIRDLMVPREIDCLLITSDSRGFQYVTGSGMRWGLVSADNWQGMGFGHCLLPLHGDPSAVWGQNCAEWDAQNISPIPDKIERNVWAPEGYMGTKPYDPNYDPATEDLLNMVKRIKTLGLEKGTVGIVGGERFSSILQKELPGVKWVDFSKDLRSLMRIKSPEELEWIRKASEILWKGFYAVASAAAPGVTERELHGALVGTLVSHGAYPGSHMFWSTRFPTDNKFYPQRWTGSERKLEKGDVICGEIFCNFCGYQSVQGHPISIGKPSEEFIEQFEIAKKIYLFARDLIRPGHTFAEIREKCIEYTSSLINKKVNTPGFIFHYWGEVLPNMVEGCFPGTRFMNTEGPNHICGSEVITTDGEPEELRKMPLEIVVV